MCVREPVCPWHWYGPALITELNDLSYQALWETRPCQHLVIVKWKHTWIHRHSGPGTQTHPWMRAPWIKDTEERKLHCLFNITESCFQNMDWPWALGTLQCRCKTFKRTYCISFICESVSKPDVFTILAYLCNQLSFCLPKWGMCPAARRSPTIRYLQPSPRCSLTRAPRRSWRKSKKSAVKLGIHVHNAEQARCLVFTMETRAVREGSNNGGSLSGSLSQRSGCISIWKSLKETPTTSHSILTLW